MSDDNARSFQTYIENASAEDRLYVWLHLDMMYSWERPLDGRFEQDPSSSNGPRFSKYPYVKAWKRTPNPSDPLRTVQMRSPHETFLVSACAYIYIIAVCGKGIWSLRSGDLVAKTLPAAEPSVSRAGIQGPRGPESPLSPLSRKRPFKHWPNLLRNHYFCSHNVVVSCESGPIFQRGPKMPKTHLPQSRVTRGRFRGGGIFVLFSCFFVVPNFLLAPLVDFNLPRLSKCLFLQSVPRFLVFHFSIFPKHPRTKFSLNFSFFEIWPEKSANK